MNQPVTLTWLDRAGIGRAQETVEQYHYLRTRVATVCCVQGYAIEVRGARAGFLLFGRPQCQRYLPWYGSVEDVQAGRCEASRWSVINLARVYIFPAYQQGGNLYLPDLLPGFRDRKGVWRSTLLSTAISLALDRIVGHYLQARPPCFLDEPYQLTWCLSYSDLRFHPKGALYRASGFERYSVNARGLVTWRTRLRPLTEEEDADIRQTSLASPRSRFYRRQRAAATWRQLELFAQREGWEWAR